VNQLFLSPQSLIAMLCGLAWTLRYSVLCRLFTFPGAQSPAIARCRIINTMRCKVTRGTGTCSLLDFSANRAAGLSVQRTNPLDKLWGEGKQLQDVLRKGSFLRRVSLQCFVGWHGLCGILCYTVCLNSQVRKARLLPGAA
jgi:hypothetical protein